MALECWKKSEGRFAPTSQLPGRKVTNALKLDQRIGNVKWESGQLILLWPIQRNYGQIHRQEKVCEAMIREIYLNTCEWMRSPNAYSLTAHPRQALQSGLDGLLNSVFIPSVWAERNTVGCEIFEYLSQRILELSVCRLQNLRRKLRTEAMRTGYSDTVRITKKLDWRNLFIPLIGPNAGVRFLLQQLNSVCKENYIVNMQAEPNEHPRAVILSIVPASIFEGNEPHYPTSFAVRRTLHLY